MTADRMRLGIEVPLGADCKATKILLSFGRVEARELSSEILRRFSTGDCKPSAVWATPFF